METNLDWRMWIGNKFRIAIPCRLCRTFSDPFCQSRRNNHLCPIHTHNCYCCRRRCHRSSNSVIHIWRSTFVWRGPNTCKPCNICIPFFSLQEQAKARSQLTSGGGASQQLWPCRQPQQSEELTTAISAIPIARAVIVVIIAVLVAFPIRRAALAAFFGTFLYLGFAIFAFALRADDIVERATFCEIRVFFTFRRRGKCSK